MQRHGHGKVSEVLILHKRHMQTTKLWPSLIPSDGLLEFFGTLEPHHTVPLDYKVVHVFFHLPIHKVLIAAVMCSEKNFKAHALSHRGTAQQCPFSCSLEAHAWTC